jgi:hypothetical protein
MGRGSSRIVVGVALTLLVVGLVRAAQLAWICDDAFVSLRYAENLVAGHGLVYNPGELVEGYTNLLWTLLLAAALYLGAPDVAAAVWLGITCYGALALLLLAASWRRHRRDHTAFLPVAAGVVLVSPDFHEWASGGLETSLFALLATAGALLARGAASNDRRALASGLVFSLLTLTRPDGVLFATAAAAAVAIGGRSRRAALLLCAPVLVTVVGWGAVKLATYGELLPTAFYSKSVLRPYYGQGLAYLGLYLAKNWFLPLALVGLVFWRWRSGQRVGARDADSLALAGSAGLFLLYVVHVGGDFMFARRLLPAVPLLLLALEDQLLRRVPARGQLAVAATCLIAAAVPYPVFDEHTPRIRGIADERRFYPPSAIEKRRRQAEAVGQALSGSGARVMFEGGMCVFGYYSRLPYLAEMTGLTHYSLARLPLPERGWIGHEKSASEEWLTQNNIHFIVSQRFPPVSRPPTGDSFDLVYFGDLAVARIHRYDDAIMDSLRDVSGVSFVPIERVIERRRREISHAAPERAREILAELDRYYFDSAGDRGRTQAEELRNLVEERAGSASRASARRP